MASGDITLLREAAFGGEGSRTYVVSPSATVINPGEPVAKALGSLVGGGAVVSPLATSKPVVGTDYMAGISASKSTNTSTASGTVDVWAMSDGVVYLISPKTSTDWNTQTKYDAAVGARLLFDLTTGVYTLNSPNNDAATSGCVVEPLNVTQYPGKVAFKIRSAVAYSS